MSTVPTRSPSWHLYIPKLYTVLLRGYGLDDFRHDLIAGLTVAVVALPLAMALAIASGTSPDKGLQRAIVAEFLISALRGSRVQIEGIFLARGGTRLILSGLREQPRSILLQMGIEPTRQVSNLPRTSERR